ncbi:MIP family Ig-specific serine endopeptidase [Mycoplasma bradburyae]|uniref:MIP family Ig-specific serine endopeptidase n=1 Tax=Mycoplasma bradburyae TaxID=2963128 RepID=UPI002341755F|nr:DUF31 family protein [Mycoplasma bradburyae]MDC4182378.1 DUF31 family protein [Mycoplasma bradburyae]
MLRKTGWFKLLCGLSAVSVVASSCFDPNKLFFSDKNKVDVNSITNDDLKIEYKKEHSKIFASQINLDNYQEYFVVKLIKKNDNKDLTDYVNIDLGDFNADDENGVLSFIVSVSVKNGDPKIKRSYSLEIDGFLKNPRNNNNNNSSNSETTNSPVIIQPNQPKLDKPIQPEIIPPTESKPEMNNDLGNDLSSGNNSGDNLDNSEPDSSETSSPSNRAEVKVFSDNEIYHKIYKRSFSLQFYTRYNFNDPKDQMNKTLYYVTNGTGWLLDYQKSVLNPNLYRLYVATNLHVAQTLWRANDFDNPINDLEKIPETVGFSIGKSDDVSFYPKPTPSFNKPAKYVTLLEDLPFYNKVPDNQNTYRVSSNRLLTIPRTIFAAVDFVRDEQTKRDFSSLWNSQFKGQFINGGLGGQNLLESAYSDNKQDRERLADQFIQKGIGLYKDFAVISFEVNIAQDIDSLNPRALIGSKLLRKYVLDAVDELNESVKVAKTPGQYNLTNPNLPYVDIDYPSVKTSTDTAISLDDLHKAYIAGYPGIDEVEDNKSVNRFKWVQNNLSKDSESSLSPNISRNLLGRLQTFNGKIQSYHNKYYHQYGLTQEVERSSLQAGSSGSVVYSKYGLPYGIFWGGYNSGSKDGFVAQQERGVFDYLAQSKKTEFKFNIRFDDSDQPMKYKINIEAYNLIDGTDKTKYPNQTNSYREALRKYLATKSHEKTKGTFLFPQP